MEMEILIETIYTIITFTQVIKQIKINIIITIF